LIHHAEYFAIGPTKMQNICMNKKIFSWALYDWANSVFYTTVMAGFFPVFFKQYWSGEVNATLSTERLGWILGISGFLLAVLSPTMGVISDKRKMKKKLLFSTMMLGALCTLGLYFVPAGDWSSAALLYGCALFMASASAVFYDSLLTSVCEPKQYDFVSSFGFSLGYLGGGLLFLLNVVMVLKPEFFGLADKGEAVKWSFVLVAVWWFIFTLPLMKNVPEPEAPPTNKSIMALTLETLQELKVLFIEIMQDKNLFYFILGYWFYIDGVFTVMSMAVDFGLALGFESADLMKALLITQFVGFPAAYLFGTMANKKISSRNLILVGLGIYAITIIGASQMSQAWHFYALAFIIGLCQGGVQALSRSLFAHLIPKEKSGEYFGFFNMLGKFASVLGPILVALFARYTSDSRQTILSLLILILAGGYLITKVKIKKTA
jgi:MFS transporter, UMF1 family